MHIRVYLDILLLFVYFVWVSGTKDNRNAKYFYSWKQKTSRTISNNLKYFVAFFNCLTKFFYFFKIVMDERNAFIKCFC